MGDGRQAAAAKEDFGRQPGIRKEDVRGMRKVPDRRVKKGRQEMSGKERIERFLVKTDNIGEERKEAEPARKDIQPEQCPSGRVGKVVQGARGRSRGRPTSKPLDIHSNEGGNESGAGKKVRKAEMPLGRWLVAGRSKAEGLTGEDRGPSREDLGLAAEGKEGTGVKGRIEEAVSLVRRRSTSARKGTEGREKNERNTTGQGSETEFEEIPGD